MARDAGEEGDGHEEGRAGREHSKGTGRRGIRSDRAHVHRRGDAAVVHQLRDERHPQPGDPRHSRWAQAGAASHPVRDAGTGRRPREASPQVRARGGRGDGQIPPPRRARDLRHHGQHGPAVLLPLPARGRAGQLRLDRRRSGGGDALHRGEAVARRHGVPRGARREDGRLGPELRRVARRADLPPGASAEPPDERGVGHIGRNDDADPSPPPRGVDRRRHRPDGRSCALGEGSHDVHPRAGFPDRRGHHGSERDRGDVPHGFGKDDGARQGGDRRRSDHHHGNPLPGEEIDDRRVHRRQGAERRDRRSVRPSRRVGPRRVADRRRAKEVGEPERRPEPVVQVHAARTDVLGDLPRDH